MTTGGGATKVNASVLVPLCASGLVTTTSTTPAAWAPVVHASDVVPVTTGLAHMTPPTMAVVPDANPVPAIVTDVPPAVGPDVGAIEVTVGAGVGATYVNALTFVPVWVSGFVTTTSTTPAA